jgi:phytoene synthase
VAAARLLGAPEAALDRARALGAAYGVAGIMRSIAVLARQGRCVLPADVLAEHGLSAWDVIGAPSSPKLAPLRAGLAAEGRMLAGQAEPCGRGWVAAALPAVLARRDLARAGQQPRPRLLGDRMAVVAAWMRGLA